MNEDTKEEPIEQQLEIQLIVTKTPDGIAFSIPNELDPITLAGIAVYLDWQAHVGFANIAQQMAQMATKQKKLWVADRLPKRNRGN